MIRTIAIAALVFSAAASAGGMYRANGKVIGPNDPVTKVTQNMGQPDSREAVTNKFGAPLGEYWYYSVGSKTVRVFVSGGRVIDIQEFR